jgi:hypothetical protein
MTWCDGRARFLVSTLEKRVKSISDAGIFSLAKLKYLPSKFTFEPYKHC